MDTVVSNEIRSGTNIVSGKDYEELILSVTALAVEAVSSTLGPYGSTTIIEDGSFTYPTKDGWSILARLRFGDPIENSIYNMIKLISFNLVNKVGDGTTSAIIGAYYFMQALFDKKYKMTQGKVFRQTYFKQAIESIKNKVIERLLTSSEKKEIIRGGNYDDIWNIAYISSNGDKVIADMIQQIYQKTNNPNILVTVNYENDTVSEIENGYRYDCKPINQKVYVNADNGICEKQYQSTYIAIFDHNVTYAEHGSLISGLSNFVNSRNGEVIIFAPYFDEILTEIIGTQVDNLIKRGSIPNIMLVQAPISMEVQKAYLTDVAVLTNGQVFNPAKVKAFNVMKHNQENPDDILENPLVGEDGYNFDTPTELIEACLGMSPHLIISERYIIFKDYMKTVNKDAYNARKAEIKELYEAAIKRGNASTTTLDKESMNARQHFIRFSGNMGTIKVGGDSESEKHYRKDAVDDAVLACKSAYDNGYVRGMNLATLSVLYKLKMQSLENDYESIVVDILYETFYRLAARVIENKYDKNEKINVGEVADVQLPTKFQFTADQIIEFCILNGRGFDLTTDTFELPGYYTVINSVSTDIETLKAILSILSLILTSTQLISTNRIIDKKLTLQQQEEKMLSEVKKKSDIMAKAFGDALNSVLADFELNLITKSEDTD